MSGTVLRMSVSGGGAAAAAHGTGFCETPDSRTPGHLPRDDMLGESLNCFTLVNKMVLSQSVSHYLIVNCYSQKQNKKPKKTQFYLKFLFWVLGFFGFFGVFWVFIILFLGKKINFF